MFAPADVPYGLCACSFAPPAFAPSAAAGAFVCVAWSGGAFSVCVHWGTEILTAHYLAGSVKSRSPSDDVKLLISLGSLIRVIYKKRCYGVALALLLGPCCRRRDGPKTCVVCRRGAVWPCSVVLSASQG